MKRFKKEKLLSCVLASSMLVSSSPSIFVYAEKAPKAQQQTESAQSNSGGEEASVAQNVTPNSQPVAVNIGVNQNNSQQPKSGFDWKSCIPGVIAGTVTSVFGHFFNYIAYYTINGIYSVGESIYNKIMFYKYSGFKKPQEAIIELQKIIDNKSDIKIYGQEKAKKQAFDALSGIVTRIDNLKKQGKNAKEVRGNIVYLIGPSGTGKTKMCEAIAQAFLKHPEKTAIFCHSESITSESELGTQLFKTIMSKDIGEKHVKNAWGMGGVKTQEEESPMLKHILKYYEGVVIIDEYDKMKQKSAKPGSTMNFGGFSMPTGTSIDGEDKSADEIFRSISSTGKYTFMNKEVDCSKILFLVTTNETREQLEKNFGIGGAQGGGVQRLNIVEFEHLPLDACRGIANDVVEEVTKVLTNSEGLFRLKKVNFSKETVEAMAKFIFDDKVMQGRAKYKLEDKIYSLLSKDIGKDYDKEINISFTYSEEQSEFSKETL